MRSLAISLAVFFVLTGCSTTQVFTGEVDPELKPDVFCQVLQPPDPLLMGVWEGYFVRDRGESNPDNNYVKYTLVKQDDKYALHFYRTWKRGRKKVNEWKNWTINGAEISGEPQFGVRIFVQDGGVYFTIRGLDEPAKLSRVQ